MAEPDAAVLRAVQDTLLHPEVVESALAHPTAPATWTEAAPLTRKRDEPIEATVAATKSREPAGEPSTLQKVPKLLLDKSRQPFSVAQTRGLHAEGLEVILDDLIDRTPSRVPRFVARGGPAHEGP
jgi:hypothetical protein